MNVKCQLLALFVFAAVLSIPTQKLMAQETAASTQKPTFTCRDEFGKEHQVYLPGPRVFAGDLSLPHGDEEIEPYTGANLDLLDVAESLSRLAGYNFIFAPAVVGRTLTIPAPGARSIKELKTSLFDGLETQKLIVVHVEGYLRVMDPCVRTKSAR